jgi:hypothetical protein
MSRVFSTYVTPEPTVAIKVSPTRPRTKYIQNEYHASPHGQASSQMRPPTAMLCTIILSLPNLSAGNSCPRLSTYPRIPVTRNSRATMTTTTVAGRFGSDHGMSARYTIVPRMSTLSVNGSAMRPKAVMCLSRRAR